MSFDNITDTHTKLMHISDYLSQPIRISMSNFYVSIEKETLFPNTKIECMFHYEDNRFSIHSRQIMIDGKDIITIENGDIDLIGFTNITTLKTDIDFIRSYLIGNGYEFTQWGRIND
jgi:hypothetical protein